MTISRKTLHDIIDKIADDRLPMVSDLLNQIYEEEHEEISSEESSKIEAARQRIFQGEYDTFDEVFGDSE